MNLSLTLNFDSEAEMLAFLNIRTSGATASIAGVVEKPAPLKAVPEVVDIDPLGTVDTVADPDLRVTLLARLRVIAAGMEDATVLGTFITGFGVTKFSDIADEDLPAFEIALNKKFKA